MSDPLATLRDRNISSGPFRKAARVVADQVLTDCKERLEKDNISEENVVFIIILRAGVAMVESITTVFPQAPIGVVGLWRDEKTAEPHWYYERFPPLTAEICVVILDPMLATGGSATETAQHLRDAGANPEKMYFFGIIGVEEGIARLSSVVPRDHISLLATDPELDAKKFIVPGLGDFGDRYFGV